VNAHPWREAPPADFAVIGDPVSHSLSPAMHNAAYTALCLPLRYMAIQVRPGEVADAFAHLKSLGYRGVNCTVPHKLEALQACREVEPFAREVDAVNTVRLEDMAGRNTDGPGFLASLNDIPRTALVLGAGGSSRAIVAALLGKGVDVRVWNRTAERARQLFGDRAVAHARVKPFDLVVNTTSASLQGERLPIDWSDPRPGLVAFDLMYGDGPTPFLKDAQPYAKQLVDGRRLLVEQGALAFEWWLGISAPREAMWQAVQD